MSQNFGRSKWKCTVPTGQETVKCDADPMGALKYVAE